MDATRAALYVRVSSNLQEEDGTSLASQQTRCRAFCAEHDYQVVSLFQDVHTGTQYRERPGLAELRALVRAGGVDVVVVYAIDRLSRNQAHLYIIAEEIEDHGARVEFVTEDFEDSAVGRFIRSARAFAAEVEHEKIKERTTRGKLERVRSGRLLPATHPLYGYEWRDDSHSQLNVNPLTEPVIRRIYAEYCGGTSIRSIVGKLTTDGIPTPTGRSSRWQYTTVRNILLNPSYKGEAYGWGLRRPEPGESQRFDPTRAVALPEGTIPPIVDSLTWNLAQERLALNKQRAIRNAKDPEAALLRGGYARCGYCGWTMSARPRSNGQYEYVCGSGRMTERICPRPTISARKLDTAVWEQVRRVLLNPDIVEAEIKRLSQEDPAERDTTLIDRLLADVDRQRSNVVRAITLADDPETTAPLVASLNELTTRRQQLSKERDTIVGEHTTRQSSLDQLTSLHEWRERVALNIDHLGYGDKRLLLDVLGLKAEVWKATHTPRFSIAARVDSDVVSSTT